MRITCRNCGGDHPVWECRRPATKSTATWVVTNRSGRAGSTPASSTIKGDMGKSEARPSAGNAASPVKVLPVDTNPYRDEMGFPPFAKSSREQTAPDRRAGDKDDQPILGDVAQGIDQGPSKAKVAGSNLAVISNKRKVGRPKFITDLKAYKAMKQKEYRKKWKERANDTKLG